MVLHTKRYTNAQLCLRQQLNISSRGARETKTHSRTHINKIDKVIASFASGKEVFFFFAFYFCRKGTHRMWRRSMPFDDAFICINSMRKNVCRFILFSLTEKNERKRIKMKSTTITLSSHFSFYFLCHFLFIFSFRSKWFKQFQNFSVLFMNNRMKNFS